MVRIMMQKVKAYLWDNRIVYAVGIFLFVMGISTGVGFSRYIQEDIVVFRGFSVSAIGAMVQNGTEGFSLFFVAWFEALQVLLLLFFFGLGILGIPFCFFFIAVQGFKMGYTASVLLSLLGIKAVGIVFVLFFILGFVYCACYTTCCSVNLRAIKIKRHMMKIKGLSRTEAARIQVYFGVGAFSALVAVLFTVLLNPCSNMLFGIL